MKKVCILLLFSFFAVTALAQTETQTDIVTDRPTQTVSAHVLPKGYFQIETGFLYSKGVRRQQETDGSVRFLVSEQFTYNTSLFRYGLNDKIELRLIQDVGNEKFATRSSKVALVPTLIGTKMHLAASESGRTQLAVLGHIGGPVLSGEANGTQADLKFSVEHSLSDKLVLSYNLGGIWENDLDYFRAMYTFVIGYNLSPKLSSFAEVYGFFEEVSESRSGFRSNHEFDFGLAYKVNPDFQLDIYGGTAISDIGIDTLIGFGLSFRVANKN